MLSSWGHLLKSSTITVCLFCFFNMCLFQLEHKLLEKSNPLLPCPNLDPRHLSQSSIHLCGLQEDICAFHKWQQEMWPDSWLGKSHWFFKRSCPCLTVRPWRSSDKRCVGRKWETYVLICSANLWIKEKEKRMMTDDIEIKRLIAAGAWITVLRDGGRWVFFDV